MPIPLTSTTNWKRIESLLGKVCVRYIDEQRITITYKVRLDFNDLVVVTFYQGRNILCKISFTKEYIDSGQFNELENNVIGEIGLALTKLKKIDINKLIGEEEFREGVRVD